MFEVFVIRGAVPFDIPFGTGERFSSLISALFTGCTLFLEVFNDISFDLTLSALVK